MTLEEINVAIDELESDEISVFNVKKLASLYIVRDNIEKSVKTSVDASERELQDVFPAYSHYKDIKRKYQMKEIPEDALVPVMKLVTQELQEFILTLYNNTYLRKERICIEQMILDITNKLSKT